MSIDDEPMTPSINGKTGDLLGDVRAILDQARQKAYASVNFAMVECYWQIGRRIVEAEQHGQRRADYGEGIIRALSRSLTNEFGVVFPMRILRISGSFILFTPISKKATQCVAN